MTTTRDQLRTELITQARRAIELDATDDAWLDIDVEVERLVPWLAPTTLAERWGELVHLVETVDLLRDGGNDGVLMVGSHVPDARSVALEQAEHQRDTALEALIGGGS